MSDTQTTNDAPVDAAQPVTFGLPDLVFTLQVYEACAQRGAFRADELSNVGAVYDRLRAFLIANNAIANPAAPVVNEEADQGDK